MKFQRCPDCGLMYDRHVRGAHCPHCKDFAWFYAIGGALFLMLIAALTAFLCAL